MNQIAFGEVNKFYKSCRILKTKSSDFMKRLEWWSISVVSKFSIEIGLICCELISTDKITKIKKQKNIMTSWIENKKLALNWCLTWNQ